MIILSDLSFIYVNPLNPTGTTCETKFYDRGVAGCNNPPFFIRAYCNLL